MSWKYDLVRVYDEKLIAPTVNDDINDGYEVGDLWIDTVTNKSYFCADNVAGAAIWNDLAGGETDPVFLASEAASFVAGDAAKLLGIEAGAEVNNISDVNATDLTDGGATTLHSHEMDIDDLTDAVITAPAKNQALLYNGTSWVNAAQGTSFTFSIATFTGSVGATNTVFEIGSGNWKAIGALSFSATYNNGPATDGDVALSGWASSLQMTGTGFIGPTANVEAVPYASVGSYKTFTLTATDGTDVDTETVRYYFYNRRFWGVSTDASGYNEADIEGLANNELSNSRAKTFTVTAAAGEYIIYAYPSRLGAATFTVGGFEGGFESPETVSVTNASGYTENYYVYRSTNSGLGATTVVVS